VAGLLGPCEGYGTQRQSDCRLDATGNTHGEPSQSVLARWRSSNFKLVVPWLHQGCPSYASRLSSSSLEGFGNWWDCKLLPWHAPAAGDDDIASVPAEVDVVAEVGHGEVLEVAGLVLLSLHRVFSTLGTFGVYEPTSFSLNVVFIFYLHDILGVIVTP
jgi:hypothetical protein